MTAAEARAAEVVAAVPQEVFATADVTPALYFAFLGSSLTFAVTTVRIHSPPAITPRVAPRTSRAILRAIALVASPAVKGSPRRRPSTGEGARCSTHLFFPRWMNHAVHAFSLLALDADAASSFLSFSFVAVRRPHQDQAHLSDDRFGASLWRGVGSVRVARRAVSRGDDFVGVRV